MMHQQNQVVPLQMNNQVMQNPQMNQNQQMINNPQMMMNSNTILNQSISTNQMKVMSDVEERWELLDDTCYGGPLCPLLCPAYTIVSLVNRVFCCTSEKVYAGYGKIKIEKISCGRLSEERHGVINVGSIIIWNCFGVSFTDVVTSKTVVYSNLLNYESATNNLKMIR